MRNKAERGNPLGIKGLVAAAFTPVNPENGKPDLERIDPLVRFISQQGVGGLYVLGTTGEGPSFTVLERESVAQQFVKSANGELPVIVNVGHDCLATAAHLAKSAQEAGAAAISSIPPLFFKPETVGDVIDSIEVIVDGAKEIPFYYYHIPQRTGVHFDMVEFLEKAPERVPNIAGVKYSHLDPAEYQICCREFGDRYDIFWGSDGTYLSASIIGAKAFIGSTYNYSARLYSAISDNLESDRHGEAERLQYLAAKAVMIIIKHGLPGLKGIMKPCGMDVGPLRPPLRTVPSGNIEAIWASLEKLGVTEFYGPVSNSGE